MALTDLTNLENKVENKGETPSGKLSANDWNTLVQAVLENQKAVRSVSFNGGAKYRPDDEGHVDLILTESNYILTLKASIDGVAPYKVALGSVFNMHLDVSNKYIDGGEQVPVSTACTAKMYCNDILVHTQDVYDGDSITFDFGKHLTEGKNKIKIRVDNGFGEIKDTMTYEVTAIYLSVSLPYFDPTEIQRGEFWTLDVKVVGSNANIYIFIDGVGGLIGGQNAGSTIGYSITDGLTTGHHKLRVYAESMEDNRVRTDAIVNEYIYVYEDSTQTVIATDLEDYYSAELYNVLSFNYWIYKGGFTGDLPVKVSILGDQEYVFSTSTQVLTFTDGVSPMKKFDVPLFETALIGERTVRIEIEDEKRDIPISVHKSDITLSDVKGYELLLSSAGRSNDDLNAKEWKSGNYSVTFPEDLEFTTNGSGWNYDADDNVALHLRRGREITLNYYPFAQNPAFGNDDDVLGTKKGMTFSIELATRNCVKRDASIVRCLYNGVGFEFFANSMTFASATESLSADYKEDTRVRIDLVIEGTPITYTYDDNGITKTSDEARMIVYVDGVYQQMLLLSSISNFKQDVAQPITIGSEYCDVDVYCIRAYNTSLNIKDITDNYSYDTPKVEDKIAIAKRCDVFDSSLNVSYPKLVKARPELPIMLIGMETLPTSKTKIPVATTSYSNPMNLDSYDDGNPSWTSANDEMGNQGTSSMNYPMPYRNFDWKTLSKSFLVGNQTFKKIPLYAGMPPIGKLTFKKDYASSEMANNIICSELYNTMALGLKDTFPNCLNDAQATLDYNKYRLSLKGIPFFIFKYWNNEYTPMGMFNFIPNKNEHEYLGFTEPFTWEKQRAQSWEIRDNNIFWDFALDESAWDKEEGKLIKNCAFTYYEAIYPKDSANMSGDENLDFGDASTEAQVEVSKDETRDILRLHNWLVSTNQSLATGSMLPTPYVDSFGKIYNYDTTAYRLAKFQTEHNYYLILDQWILYYIWREQLWMFDSGSKNLQLHTYDGQHWGCHVRDCDTALGIDNEGKFVFPPYIEDIDFRRGTEFIFNQKSQPAGSETVLNGQLGAIWINIRDGFADRIQQMYVTLYENAASTKFNYENLISWFEDHQGKWSEALYNFGSKQYYGGTPYSKWISSGLGDKKNQRRFWLYYGFRYRASKYHAGSATNRITWRQFGMGSDLQMKTYSQMYVSLGFGTYDYKTTKRYRCIDLENGVTVKNEFTTNVNDVVMYLFNGDMITDIGNLYEFGNIGSLDLTNAKRLRWLRVGNRLDESIINTKLTALVLTNCDALEYLDLTSCQGFGTATGQNGIYTLDLTNQTLLSEFYCKNSTLSGITFPETPSLKKIHLTSNLNRLRLVNLTGLQEISYEPSNKLQSVVIRNCNTVSSTLSYDIISSVLALEDNQLNDIQIEYIDWQNASADVISILCDKKAKLKGKINIQGENQVTLELKNKLIKEYGNVDDPNNALYVTYVQRDLKKLTMDSIAYFTETGQYQLTYNVDSVYVNTISSIKWDLPTNLYATINADTGLLNVTRIGEEVDGAGPNVDVTLTITLLNGSIFTATSNLNFWLRSCKIGDAIYNDGTYSSADEVQINLNKGKDVIGACFYIDPEDKSRRLMVALDSSSFNTSWGINSISMPNFTLNDNVGLVLNDIKEIPTIVSFGARNFSEMKTEVGGDGDGFTIFNPETQSIGSIGWMRVVENKFGYKAGDYVPYGKYYTAAIIDVRDKVLMDSAVNLEIPSATNYVSEFDSLTLLINNVMEEMGSGYRDIYFPAASYCYAYEPKTNKELAPQFKAHNWWLPSAGELARLAYYTRLITIGTEEDKEDNLFKPLYDLGLLKVLSADYLFTSSEANNQSILILVIYQTNVNNKNIIQNSSNYKHNVRRFRPICSF